jgi:ribosomal protein S18 acetylase RimI-like enzyme
MEKVVISNKYGFRFEFRENLNNHAFAGVNVTLQERVDNAMIGVLPALSYKPTLYISCFGVYDRCNRGKGYGRIMLRWLKDYFNGCVLWLEVSSLGPMTNEQLIGFYKSEGFIESPDNNNRKYPLMYMEL